MSDEDEGQERFDGLNRATNRRRFVEAVVAASVGALAGCGGDGDGTPTETPTDTGTTTDTPTDSGPSTPSSTSTPESQTPTETPTQEQREPVTEELAQSITTIPAQSVVEWYPPATIINQGGFSMMNEMVLPFRNTGEYKPSGHTWDVPGVGEVPVHAWVKDWTVEPPFDWWETYDDEITYWDGTDMDANAAKYDNMIAYYAEPPHGKWTAAPPRYEVVDKWRFHQWAAKGNVEGVSANPANKFTLYYPRYWVPPHPDYSRPYARQAKNATTKSEASELWNTIQNDTVGFPRLAKNDWGSGLYKIPDTDAISSDKIELQARQDHPNYRDNITDNLLLRVATGNRVDVLKTQGLIDIAQGVISPKSGAVNRQSLPDYIQQLSTVGGWAIFGIPINWHDSHLGNLWVRRALVEAVDWKLVNDAGTFPGGYVPQKHTTGLSEALTKRWFSQDFIDNLHVWSYRANREKARQYMQRAGYSKVGGNWVSPEGETAQILAKTAAGLGQSYVRSLQAMKSMLDSFGLQVKFDSISTNAFKAARRNKSYSILWQWNNQRDPWEGYTSSSGWWNPKIVGLDPDYPNSSDGWSDQPNGRSPDPEPVRGPNGEVVDPADHVDDRGQPLDVQVPTQVGTIEAPDEAGTEPDLEGAGMDVKKFNLMEHIIEMHTDPDLTESRLETIMEDLAWYHNYYIPDYWSANYATGLYGNVRDYNWASGTKAMAMTARLGANMVPYVIQGGLVFEKYDQGYSPP